MAAKKVMKLMVLNQEIIKPSSPTPSHLQTFKLSFIDQYIFPVRMPLVLFYRAGGDNVGLRLKKSLSETLNCFYPVAGRLSADLYEINCANEGVHYHQVRANLSMSEALQTPENEELDRLIPNTSAKVGLALAPLLEVQATYFECGGVAIGLSMSHKVGDATSLHIFAKAWSRATLGNQDLMVPDFIAPSALPGQNPPLVQLSLPPIEPAKYIARRFVIDASKMRDLRAIAASDDVPHPTRTEVVSALLWKCSMKATDRLSSPGMPIKPSILTWLVNIRSKLTPPLSDSSMGNIFAMLLFQHGEEIRSLAALVCKLRHGVEVFRGKFTKDQFQGGKEQRISATLRLFSEYHKVFDQAYADSIAHASAHTSCCGLRFYDIDFGWGKPAWVSIPLYLPNSTVFTGTPCGGGVVVFVNLTKEDMDLLEHDPEFLGFASTNPSPLQVETSGQALRESNRGTVRREVVV